jgi:hypothetical protein
MSLYPFCRTLSGRCDEEKTFRLPGIERCWETPPSHNSTAVRVYSDISPRTISLHTLQFQQVQEPLEAPDCAFSTLHITIKYLLQLLR